MTWNDLAEFISKMNDKQRNRPAWKFKVDFGTKKGWFYFRELEKEGNFVDFHVISGHDDKGMLDAFSKDGNVPAYGDWYIG